MTVAPHPPTIKGWCPSVLRPMETGDGLLVRLHLTGGELSRALCGTIADLAEAYGNGLIDLSQRGNLQLRGVQATTLPALTAALDSLDLIGRTAGGNDLWSVIASPLAGRDPTARIDGARLVRRLGAQLAAATDLSSLPGKFCFLVDEGGRLGLDDVAADIRLTGFEGAVVLSIPSGEGHAMPVAMTSEAEASNAALALARAFLTLSTRVSARRMDQLVQALGANEIARAAGFSSDASLKPLPRQTTEARQVIGVQDGFIGVAAPFGRLDAAQMRTLAALAPETLRLTPWRAILLPGAKADDLATLERTGLIVSPEDARLAVVACPGRPACNSAQIDTRLAAQELAPLARRYAPQGMTMHISGCPKGCAQKAKTPFTLVGREGAYDLVFDGSADAEPQMRGLDLAQIATVIRETTARKIAS